MKLINNIITKLVIIIILISLLITFVVTPSAYAKLDLKDGDFYYSGTTEGTYTVSNGIFEWLLTSIGDIVDWILGIITLGFRMVFVGWTALIEKLLTWALESTAGVDVDGELVENSNDLTSLSDSSGNVTVEAIVYNQVPALNINFFDTEYDKTVSGTGQKIMCKCGKTAEECLGTPNPASINVNSIICTDSSCNCNGCDGCVKYAKQLTADEPVIVKIKEMVAMWYYVLLMLSLVAMLVVLIVVGIKMAISTIASDKAVYKRMLVDWVVGILIIFLVHFFMYFSIYITESLVDVVHKSANSVNEVKMKQLTNSESKFTNSQIEIKIYEEIRTRAYDAKLSNGIIGMIMYMSMVYFAFRYTLIYIKRYFTIIVLTLMGPPIGVAYALQKAISGKSNALKKWMMEYLINALIQVVHALLYAVFISQALFLSLESISGMIIALVLMNYTMKADKLFKKIFHFGGGGSFLDETENAMENARNKLKQTKSLVLGSKTATKMLTNSPWGKLVKGTGKAALATGVAFSKPVNKTLNSAISKATESVSNLKDDLEEKVLQKEMDKNGAGYSKKANETDEEYNTRRNEAINNLSGFAGKKVKKDMQDRELAEKDESVLQQNLLDAKNELLKKDNPTEDERTERREKYLEAAREYDKYKQLTTPTPVKAFGTKLKNVATDNYFLTRSANENRTIGQKMKDIHDGTFGSLHWDSQNWKLVREKNAVYNKLAPSKALGLTDQDKKVLKEHLINPIKYGFGGMAGVFFGMATIVAEPKLGLGLLASGVVLGNKAKCSGVSNKYNGKYSGLRYANASTVKYMERLVLARNSSESAYLKAFEIEGKHPGFTAKLLDGSISAISLGMGGSYRGHLDAINAHSAKQQNEQIRKFKVESAQTIAKVAQANLYGTFNSFEKNVRKEEMIAHGFTVDKETKQSMYIGTTEERAAYRKAGYEIDIDTGKITYTANPSKQVVEQISKVEDKDIVNKINGITVNRTTVSVIDKEINTVIDNMYKSSNVDMNTKKDQDKAVSQLTLNLTNKGILKKDQTVDQLFTDGKSGVTRILKQKVAVKTANDLAEANKKLSDNLSQEEAQKIINIVEDITQEKLQNGVNNLKIDSNEVVDKLKNLNNVVSDINPDSTTVPNPTTSFGVEPDPIDNSDRQLAITAYLNEITPKMKNMHRIGKKRTATSVETQAIEDKIAKRKKKLEQIMQITLGNELEENNATIQDSDAIVEQLLEQKNSDEIVLSSQTIKLDKNERKTAKQMVQNLIEMEAVNQSIEKNYVLSDEASKTAPNSYKKKRKNKKRLLAEINSLETQKTVLELKKQQYSSQPQTASIIEEIEILEKDIDKKNMEINIKKDNIKLINQKIFDQGPIVDVNDVVSELLKKKGGAI